MPGRTQLTELDRMRVRTLFYDAQFRVSRIREVTGYGTSQIRRAIKDPTPKKRPGRPRKDKGPEEGVAVEEGSAESQLAAQLKPKPKSKRPRQSTKPRAPKEPQPAGQAHSGLESTEAQSLTQPLPPAPSQSHPPAPSAPAPSAPSAQHYPSQPARQQATTQAYPPQTYIDTYTQSSSGQRPVLWGSQF
ncbi:hypothetical protein NKR23_g11213 [Pleurostoma richardsiae]|uniref:Uncharacterized protein n=1 Tax=Pleurostoma richardsiae TaxID=41990 RepID=A0AA38R895_9PEZI|nr:hypothetical protein NKR23_g11213 [Pleurostoma richardsiae]